MSSFNLSDWALRHKSFVVYLMLISAIAGIYAYGQLGREEDPPFTIKTMLIKTLWTGANAVETVKQVTDRLEKKLEEVPHLDYVRSYTKPGGSVIYVNVKDSAPADVVLQLEAVLILVVINRIDHLTLSVISLRPSCKIVPGHSCKFQVGSHVLQRQTPPMRPDWWPDHRVQLRSGR